MAREISYTETLKVVSCWCGMHLAVPETLYEFALTKPHNIYCPLGHTFVFRDTYKDKYEREQRGHQATKDLLHAEERSHTATRGHLTRARKRAAAGVCPCCHRTFKNVQRHVSSQHPDFNPESLPA